MATIGPQDSLRAATDAVRTAAEEANRLVQTALDDVERSTVQAAPGALLFGTSAALGLSGLSALLVGFGLSLSRRRSWGPMLLGSLLLGVSVACVAVGISSLPEHPFSRTRNELRQDFSAAADALR